MDLTQYSAGSGTTRYDQTVIADIVVVDIAIVNIVTTAIAEQ
jgi:hypothetical protein